MFGLAEDTSISGWYGYQSSAFNSLSAVSAIIRSSHYMLAPMLYAELFKPLCLRLCFISGVHYFVLCITEQTQSIAYTKTIAIGSDRIKTESTNASVTKTATALSPAISRLFQLPLAFPTDDRAGVQSELHLVYGLLAESAMPGRERRQQRFVWELGIHAWLSLAIDTGVQVRPQVGYLRVDSM